jgi:hypothetical protein
MLFYTAVITPKAFGLYKQDGLDLRDRVRDKARRHALVIARPL